jgi:hypothetical protein
MKNLVQQTEIKEDLTSIWLLTAGKHLQCDVDKGREIACQLLAIATEVTDTALLGLKARDHI